MTQDEIIEALKQAGASPFYGCKTRDDGTGDCPCDENDKCTQPELVGIRLPFENAAIITKFVDLILASQASELVACMYVSDDGECEEIGHLDNYNGIVPNEFTPLYTKPQPTSQDAERLRYLYTYYCFKGQIVDTPYDDWIANIDAMKESKP